MVRCQEVATLGDERKRGSKSAPDSRRELLDAAIGVFKAKGITQTTVADIAEAAGVAKGTFYLYFESRDHLLGALRESLVQETLERSSQLYQRVGEEDRWALVDTMIESVVGLMYERRDVIAIFVQEGLTPSTVELFGECDRRLNTMLASGIQAGVDAGTFAVDDPLATAALLHHAVEGATLEAILYETGLTKEQVVAAAKQLTHKTLSP